MERSTQNNGFIKAQNKGYTIHLGDEYVGHVVINEKRVSPATIANLQNPAIMKAVLSECEFRAFVPEEERTNRDTSGIDAIASAVNAVVKEAPAEPEAPAQTGSPLDNLAQG